MPDIPDVRQSLNSKEQNLTEPARGFTRTAMKQIMTQVPYTQMCTSGFVKQRDR